MANTSEWLHWNPTLSVLFSRLIGVTWALCMAWVFVVASRDQRPLFTSRDECGTDPADIVRPGQLLDESTLRFLIAAHCANAVYLPDERIALRFGGGPVDVETRRLTIGGATHYKIISVGGETAP
jgi:hypothetical protein